MGGWQWVSGVWVPLGQNEVNIQSPPPAPLDEGTSAPAPDAAGTYVPGCWVFDQGRYLWRPGYWVAYHDGWVWTRAHYLWTPTGAIFVDGYWDYALDRRGLLFAPVNFDQGIFKRPNWAYVPHYVVRPDVLLASLFLRSATRYYYVGDYFGARYEQAGYVPWLNARINRHTPDPLFSYYRHPPEGERWEREQRELHTSRSRGQGQLPPRTLSQQNQVIQNLRREATPNNTTINHMTVVHPLPEAQSGNIKLREVPREQHKELRKSVEWHREVQGQRQTHEAQAPGRNPVTVERRPPL
jgi:hypothetical protein